jgi:anaerobic ribonucleoside-triphosphate reductase activating protein
MVKYYNAMVVFEEIPDEITLAINITNCPCHCKGCHSKFLWEDVGTELTFKELERLIKENKGITCVCFMGGDADPKEINELAKKMVESNKYGKLNIGWYSGRDKISEDIDLLYFDYVKIGHYSSKFGGLDKETTNQRLYKIGFFDKTDITHKFWRKKDEKRDSQNG